MCHRKGYTVMTVAGFPMVGGPGVLNRCHATKVRGAWDGVSPFFLACFVALRLLACPIDSGIREVTSRQGPRSLVPRTMGGSMHGPGPVRSPEARASGGTRSVGLCRLVACW